MQRTSLDLKVISVVKIYQHFRHEYVVYRERIQHDGRDHDSGHDHQEEVCLGKRLRKNHLRSGHNNQVEISQGKKETNKKNHRKHKNHMSESKRGIMQEAGWDKQLAKEIYLAIKKSTM